MTDGGRAPSNLLATMTSLSADDRALLLRGLTHPERRELDARWRLWAHRAQLPPAGDAWRVWLIRAGRGFGKTRAGAEWVSAFARDHPTARIALVGATRADGAAVMVHGPSGVLAVARAEERPAWRATTRTVEFPSGAVAHLYSAAAPDTLRGPEHHAAWCDELGKWANGDAAWDNLLMGLRAGDRPRAVVTTTPRPTGLMRRVMAAPGTVDVTGGTWQNPYLPDDFVARMRALYANTRLGRQELEGELLDDHEGALWTRATLDACRVDATPALARVVVAVDPPASADGDACGIVAVGLGEDGCAYVLADATVAGLSPRGWGEAVAACARCHGADRVVVEANQGGDMAVHVLRGADPTLAVRPVHASRGKVARAEPVAGRYEQGQVRHVGAFPALEDQLAGLLVGGAYRGPGRSPDRADALVWAVWELLLREPRGEARVRGL